MHSHVHCSLIPIAKMWKQFKKYFNYHLAFLSTDFTESFIFFRLQRKTLASCPIKRNGGTASVSRYLTKEKENRSHGGPRSERKAGPAHPTCQHRELVLRPHVSRSQHTRVERSGSRDEEDCSSSLPVRVLFTRLPLL